MSLTISGTWNADSGMNMQGQWITVGYFVHVPEGILCATCREGYRTGLYELKLAYGTTDGSGNYSLSLPEDKIVAYAVLTGYYRFWAENDCAPTPVGADNLQVAWWRNADGSIYGSGALISGSPDTAGNEPYFQGCEGAPQFAYTGDLEATYRLSPFATVCLFYLPYIEGIKAERAPRSGADWIYLSGAKTASATVTGYRPQIQAVGTCAGSGGGAKKLNGVTLLVTGVYGSETVTTDADGLATLSQVDPNVIVQVQATAGLPTCGSLSTYAAYTPPTSSNAPSFDQNVYYGTVPHDSRPGLAVSPSCGTVINGHQFLYCNCGSSVSHVALQADCIDNAVVAAWTDSGGNLTISANRQPQRDIGQNAQHWDTPYTLETSGASDLGLVYLPNRTLSLCYDLSGSKKVRTNLKYGTAASGDWSAATTPSPAVSRHSSSGRGQGQAWRFRALGGWGPPLTAGNIEFSQCRDNMGLTWTAPATAVTGARGPLCGGAWLDNEYGLLYTRDADGHIYFLAATDPANWPAGPGTDTGLTGQVASLAQNAAGVLVALLWDPSVQTCQAARSRDQGKTWEQDTAAIAAIPALSRPPVLVAAAHLFLAIYIMDNRPQFAASVDGGLTWR